MPTKKTINRNNFINSGLTPITNYLKARDNFNYRLWRIVGGKLVTPFNGIFLTEEEFRKRHPVPAPLSFRRSPENADRRNLYLNS